MPRKKSTPTPEPSKGWIPKQRTRRIALEMIQAAAARGELKPGATIIESSTGNTGFALSSVGRMLGYNVTIYETMPGKAGAEKSKMMRNVGAEVRLMEPEDIEHLVGRDLAGFAHGQRCATTRPGIMVKSIWHQKPSCERRLPVPRPQSLAIG